MRRLFYYLDAQFDFHSAVDAGAKTVVIRHLEGLLERMPGISLHHVNQIAEDEDGVLHLHVLLLAEGNGRRAMDTGLLRGALYNKVGARQTMSLSDQSMVVLSELRRVRFDISQDTSKNAA